MIKKIRALIAKRDVNSDVDTTQKDHTILSGFKGGAQFDDHIDREHEMTHFEAMWFVLRGAKYVRYVWKLFLAKWFLGTAIIIPGLFIGWFWKIVTDHVILNQPLVADEVNFPPHMNWLLRILEGHTPLEIMLMLVVVYLFGLFLIGTRAGGTGAGLYGGRDTASNAENAISGGGSSAGGIWGIVEWWVDVRTTQRFVNRLRGDLFGRLIRSPMTTIDDHRVGDSLYRTLYDTPMVYTCLTEITFSPFYTFVGLGLTFYQLWWTYADVSIQLIALLALMLPITIVTTLAPSRWIRRMSQNARASGAATTNALEQTMNNISAVQSLGGMAKEKERFVKRSTHAFWRSRIAMFPWIGVGVIIEFAGWPIGFYLAWHVTNLVIEGKLTVGDFGALFGMYMGLRGTFIGLGRLWLNIQDQAAAARRVFYFMDAPIDEDPHKGEIKLPTIRESVTFENVDFTYPNGHQALKHVDLNMPFNQVIAFVGPTGSGKTSLAYLVPSFLKASSGRVLVDGHDVMDVDLDSLRDQVAYIFQEHFLLSESIRENLLVAKPDASDDDIMQALETAGCMEFIEKLPQGIHTVLGRSGDTLSVGQQQRLSIARGLIREAKILILDEPTAALDPQTENILVRSLRNAAEGRLVVVIAHRLSTIRQADQIVFLEDGEIKDVGSHDELMAIEGSPYREFVELQSAMR